MNSGTEVPKATKTAVLARIAEALSTYLKEYAVAGGMIEIGLKTKLKYAVVSGMIEIGLKNKLKCAALGGMIEIGLKNKLKSAALDGMIEIGLKNKLKSAALGVMIEIGLKNKLKSAAVGGMVEIGLKNKLKCAVVGGMRVEMPKVCCAYMCSSLYGFSYNTRRTIDYMNNFRQHFVQVPILRSQSPAGNPASCPRDGDGDEMLWMMARKKPPKGWRQLFALQLSG